MSIGSAQVSVGGLIDLRVTELCWQDTFNHIMSLVQTQVIGSSNDHHIDYGAI